MQSFFFLYLPSCLVANSALYSVAHFSDVDQLVNGVTKDSDSGHSYPRSPNRTVKNSFHWYGLEFAPVICTEPLLLIHGSYRTYSVSIRCQSLVWFGSGTPLTEVIQPLEVYTSNA